MRLTIWEIECQVDSSVYNIRSETKKAALRTLESLDYASYEQRKPSEWDNPDAERGIILSRKTFEYDSHFELLDALTGEAKGHELIIDQKNIFIKKELESN